MPLALDEVAHPKYAYIVKSYRKTALVLMYSGTFSDADLANVVCDHAQGRRTCFSRGAAQSWSWRGKKSKLVEVMDGIGCSCANCHVKNAAVKHKQCSRCRFMRYCSSECAKRHWKSGHQETCEAVRVVYNHKERRHAWQCNVTYGYTNRYDFELAYHLLDDSNN